MKICRKRPDEHPDFYVSVIIPVYNSERYLRTAVESVLKQTYDFFELIVVDDGSVDGSSNVIKSFEAIRYRFQPHSGISSARNAGIAMARGGIVAFLDADDIWLPDKLESQVSFLKSHPDVDCVICKYKGFFQSGEDIPGWVNQASFLEENVGYLPSCMILRKQAFDRVGLFDTSLRTGEDLEWFSRARRAGIEIEKLARILVRKRYHGRNTSYGSRSNKAHLFRIFRNNIQADGRKR